MQQDALAIKTINSLPINIKLNTTLISETPSWNAPVSTGPTGVSVINKLNEGFGYFGSTVHGGSNTFGLATNKYAVTSEDIVSYLFPENGNGLDNLTNYTKPGVYFGISCRVVPYQNTKSFDNGGWYNIGQAFTLCMGGGVAFMGGVANLHEYESGNMNVKFALGLASNTVSHQFSKLLDYANDTLQYTTMNPGWIIGSATYNRRFYFRKVHTLIGCPEMEMWNNTPLIFSGVTTSRYTNNLRVYSGGVSGATITVSSQDGVLYHETYQLQGTEISALFTNVPQDPIIVITKTNYKPYISGKTFKVSSEFIQNEIISDYSINSHNFPKIGSDVTSTKTFGPVTISPTGTLILNATDGVLIKNDFTIELGGEFIINIK